VAKEKKSWHTLAKPAWRGKATFETVPSPAGDPNPQTPEKLAASIFDALGIP
jgi:hypothetical protein